MRRETKEYLIKSLFFSVALASIIILILIALFLFWEGAPIFSQISVKHFLFGKLWYPTSDPADFGIFTLIIGTLSVTFVSAIISVPLGVLSAIYLAEIASPRIREWLKPIIELLSALPSVVIGFFGMVVVAPFLQNTFGIPIGLNLFNAALMLSFMAIPTICSISEDALHSVPLRLKEASLALGATHLETLLYVQIPAAISGISTAIMLGLSRVVGETMVVLMVAGGAAMIPSSIFDPVRPLTASIAAEMAEAPYRSEHYHALFATGIVLFVMTFIFNLIADYLSNKYRQIGDASL